MANALRPMTTGEILDRTFSVYRHNFKLFVAIGTIPAFLWFATNAVVVLMSNAQPRGIGGRFNPTAVILAGVTALVGFGAYMCGVAISHGAVAYAVSAIHLDQPTGFGESYRRLKGKYLRVLNVFISVGIRIFGTVLIVILAAVGASRYLMTPGDQSEAAILAIAWICVVIGLIWFILRMSGRYAFSVPAAVLEDLPGRKAIRRSSLLAKGSVGRILAVYLLFTLVNGAFSVAVQMPFQVAIVSMKTQMARVVLALGNTLSTSIVAAVVGPLITIAITLLYYDERIRKEAFDLNYMMEMLDTPALPVESQPAASADATSA